MREVTATEIHGELVLERDIVLEEAHNVVREVTKKSHVADRMRALGFTSAKGVDQITHAASRILLEQERNYAEKYPGLKFVPKEAMTKVCFKYDLVIGPLSNYTGDVPEWALEMIEKNKHLWKKELTPVATARRSNDQLIVDDPVLLTSFRVSFPTAADWMVRLSDGDGWINQQWMNQCSGLTNWASTRYQQASPVGELCIAAPRKEMKVGTNQLVVGHEIMNVRDPIVSLRVDGGFIVLAAWGEEGSDPAILNPLNN